MKLTKFLIFFLIFLNTRNSYTNTYKTDEINKNQITQKPIVVIIPSYNNKNWFQKNLDSVFFQKYDNYRIIYINDASPDGTGKLVQDYIKECNQEYRVTLINNTENRGAMANHYTAVHMCQDDEIVLQLDGDDWFKHDLVLQHINKAYQDKNVWLTYGQYEKTKLKGKNQKTDKLKGQCRPFPKEVIKNNSYREHKWISSHLRTFYAGLFKHIKLKDFLCDGKFFDATCDLGMMFPLLEMTGGKFKCIEEILYVYNRLNPISDHNLKLLRQIYLSNFIKSKTKYDALQYTDIPTQNLSKTLKADMVIILDKKAQNFYKILQSIFLYTKSLGNVYVLLKSSDKKRDKEYIENIQNIINKKQYFKLKILKYKPHTFKLTLENTLDICPHEYVILSNNTFSLKSPICIKNCIKLIEQTNAHGFYFYLGKKNQNTPIHAKLYKNVYLWQFQYGQQEWRIPNNLYMTLYRKKDIISSIKNISYNSIDTLLDIWNDGYFDLENIGLFFEKEKAFPTYLKKNWRKKNEA